MGHADTLCLNITSEILEILITQVAGCHLDADLMQLGVSACVEMDDMEGDVVLVAERLGKGFVTMALVATQQEITMRGLHLITQLF